MLTYEWPLMKNAVTSLWPYIPTFKVMYFRICHGARSYVRETESGDMLSVQ